HPRRTHRRARLAGRATRPTRARACRAARRGQRRGGPRGSAVERRRRRGRVLGRLAPDRAAARARFARGDPSHPRAPAPRRDQRPRADARRRLPAAHRRLARRGRLEKGASMSTVDIALPAPVRPRARVGPLFTLARRRLQLTVRTPRELVVPLLTPIMFASVIAPALMTALHTAASYKAFVAVGTVGLLIPLNTMFAGLSVIVDRES